MIHIELNNTNLVCSPDVDLIADHVPEMRDILLEEFQQNLSWTSLTMDYNKVKALDAMGINLLIGLLKTTQAFDKKLRIINCSEEIVKVLQNFRLDRFIKIESM